MTVELSFGKVTQGLIIAGITAIIIYLWNIDSRVQVLEKQQSVVERVSRLETAMLPVLATWRAEEIHKKEHKELRLPRFTGTTGGDGLEENESDELEVIYPMPPTKEETIQMEAADWAREQLPRSAE